MLKWNYSVESLPRNPYPAGPYTHDLLRCSPNGKYAALAYSINEMRMLTYVGFLALFGGEPAAPQLLFTDSEFRCMGFKNSLQWLDNENVLCVQAYMFDRKTMQLEIPFCFFNVLDQTFAFYPLLSSANMVIENADGKWIIRELEKPTTLKSHEAEVIEAQKLQWLPWSKIKEGMRDYFFGAFGHAT